MAFLADNAVLKVPLVVAAIVVLLLINSFLQYAAGPALEQTLPLHEGRQLIHAGQGPVSKSSEGLGAPDDAAVEHPAGGADAELLCTDRMAGCDTTMCGHLEVKYQQCKLTCNACERLRASIQGDTGLQVRVVQQLSPCNDLHPSCSAWAQQDSCHKDPKAMLGLCQPGGCAATAASGWRASALAVVTTAASGCFWRVSRAVQHAFGLRSWRLLFKSARQPLVSPLSCHAAAAAGCVQAAPERPN
eukprot:gene8778-8956_t